MDKTQYTLKAGGILLLLLFTGSWQLNAQGFSLSQDTVMTHMKVSPNDTDALFEHSVYVSTTGSGITLSWKVISDEIPKAWYYQVCDRLQCYGEKALAKEKVKTSPEFDSDTTGLLKPGIRPRGLEGQGKMHIIVWDVNNTSDVDTLVVIYDAVLSLPHTLHQAIELFPNPASQSLHFDLSENTSNITEVSVIDFLGRKQNAIYAQNGNSISIYIEDLTEGTYLLQSTNEEGNTYIGRFTKM